MSDRTTDDLKRCKYVTRWHDGLPFDRCGQQFIGGGHRCPDHWPKHDVAWPTNTEETDPS